MGKKKGTGSSEAAAAPFQFSGGFSVGTGLAGEDKAAKGASPAASGETKKTSKKAPAEEEDDEEDDGDDEDESLDFQDLIDLSSLPKEVRKRVKALQKLQGDYNTVDEEYKKARIELERTFLQRKTTLYEARRSIAIGEVDVPDLPLAEGEEAEVEEVAAEPAEPEKGIPYFWAQVLNAHPQIGSYVTEADIPALQAITNITCSYDEEFKSFTLQFHFDENEFFTNSVLTKTYHVTPDLLDDKAPSLKSTDGFEIDWKEGKNLCVEETVKKQRAKSGRNKGQVRTIKVTKPKQSFFQFFYPQSAEDDEDEEDEKEDKEDEDWKIHPEDDYDIGHAIRTSIIPEAILWYTGEAALQYDYMFGGGDEDDEDEDEDGDDDEEGDDESDDEEEEAPKGKPAKKTKSSSGGDAVSPPPATGADGEKPAECKQN